ncbi:DUF6940 family protein [Catalinimonas niigatensis]|uniref:DUF6940 family protein n=1 Tax=Catalinimonas niigatensis TaxID=1397264 RepID=UPI0026664DD5|nr:hypothetical protein [Catalinimonas niigatensis]WPP52886.1 hypothetical protein PZB72_10915 [Catalinimonas niigatensis]
MWQAITDKLQNGHVLQYFIQSGKRKLTYAQVIWLWQKKAAFRKFFSALLAHSPFDAFFWECPPLTEKNQHQLFEFVLLDSPQLAGREADCSAFQQHLVHTSESVGNFSNLGGDAHLLVPVPQGVAQHYAHIAAFVRHAAPAQQHALWQKLGELVEVKISQQPLWVSTSGLGVPCLHVRLDSRPKYYEFAPYRQHIV